VLQNVDDCHTREAAVPADSDSWSVAGDQHMLTVVAGVVE
jgi:hypothetical protein